MITFVAPASSSFFAENTTFTVDRNPQSSKVVDILSTSVPYAVLEQSRENGINAVRESFSFNIVNLTAAQAYALDGYFNELKGSEAITITFPEGDKNFQIVDWSVIVSNGKYMSISAQAQEVFL